MPHSNCFSSTQEISQGAHPLYRILVFLLSTLQQGSPNPGSVPRVLVRNWVAPQRVNSRWVKLHLYWQLFLFTRLTTWAPPPFRSAATLDYHKSTNPKCASILPKPYPLSCFFFFLIVFHDTQKTEDCCSKKGPVPQWNTYSESSISGIVCWNQDTWLTDRSRVRRMITVTSRWAPIPFSCPKCQRVKLLVQVSWIHNRSLSRDSANAAKRGTAQSTS